MPPVNQGSRGLMAAWIVIMAIVGVVCSILAIYFYVDSDKVNKELKTRNEQYADVLPSSMLNSEDIAELKLARENEANGFDRSMKLFEVALAQRGRLAKMISGGDDEGKAVIAANQAIQKIKDAGLTPGDNLSAAVEALLTEVNARRTEAASNKADSEQSKKTLDETLANMKATIDSITKQLEDVRAEKDQAMAQLQEITNAQRTGFEGTAGEIRQQLEASQAQVNQLNTDNAGLVQEIDKLKTQVASLQAKLAEFRVDPAKTVVRQADGHISRIVERGFCFIDIGNGHHVTPGLTFEVFDKIEGIPEPGDPTNDENLPKGKASIEVVDAFTGGSKCRVTRLSPGAVLAEGDAIVNIVYDRNTQYNFVVYGNFDLDRNGTATAPDAEVVKQLINNWGGKVVTSINVDTDFVVLGKEPEIPEKPEETDPLLQRQYEEALAAYEEYGRISKEARDYRIPILNQNRFLYLCGYYDASKR
jgi:regulator of replication initiation timing